MKTKFYQRVAILGLLLALAIIFGYVEAILPISVGIPGVKLGLSNIVMVFMLFAKTQNRKDDFKGNSRNQVFSAPEIFAVSAARVLVIGFMFGNMFSILYGLAGALLSLVAMTLLKRTGAFHIIGISAAGGAAHNVGQVLVAYAVAPALPFLWYLPILLIVGTATGALMGFVSTLVISRMH